MTRFLLTTCLLFCQASGLAFAGVTDFRVGDIIELTAPFDADDYDWKIVGANYRESSNGKSVIVGAASNRDGSARAYTADVAGASIVDGKAVIQRGVVPFTVSWPDSPDPPQPTPITLRELVTAEQATRLAEYFRSFAAVIGTYKSPAQFWSAYDATFPVKGNAQLDAALKNRLEGPVEAKKGLSVVLLAIAKEFEGETPVPPTPPVPPATEGKRVVVIAQATEHEDPELDRVIVQLRKPGSTGQSFLAKAGHTLDILDDELIRKSKWNSLLGSKLSNLPKLFVIDPQTNTILFEQTIANGTTADNIIERIRETGG